MPWSGDQEAFQSLGPGRNEELPFLAGREAMAAGDVLPVSLGDYVEV